MTAMATANQPPREQKFSRYRSVRNAAVSNQLPSSPDASANANAQQASPNSGNGSPSVARSKSRYHRNPAPAPTPAPASPLPIQQSSSSRERLRARGGDKDTSKKEDVEGEERATEDRWDAYAALTGRKASVGLGSVEEGFLKQQTQPGRRAEATTREAGEEAVMASSPVEGASRRQRVSPERDAQRVERKETARRPVQQQQISRQQVDTRQHTTPTQPASEGLNAAPQTRHEAASQEQVTALAEEEHAFRLRQRKEFERAARMQKIEKMEQQIAANERAAAREAKKTSPLKEKFGLLGRKKTAGKSEPHRPVGGERGEDLKRIIGAPRAVGEDKESGGEKDVTRSVSRWNTVGGDGGGGGTLPGTDAPISAVNAGERVSSEEILLLTEWIEMLIFWYRESSFSAIRPPCSSLLLPRLPLWTFYIRRRMSWLRRSTLVPLSSSKHSIRLAWKDLSANTSMYET